MANKVKYNLKNVHYAPMIGGDVASDGTATYGDPVKFPGAVSISLDAEGDTNKFYADGIAYFTSITNNGYSGDLEMAMLTDDFRVNVLGEELDSNGVMVEQVGKAPIHFALMFEFDGDQKAIRHVLYNCVATRPSIEGDTSEESIEPQTETVTLNATSIYNLNLNQNIVKGKTGVDSAEATYNAWYNAVYQPGDAPTLSSVTVAPESGVLFGVSTNDMQSDVEVKNGRITGTLKFLDGDNDIVDVWGSGNFVCLKFSNLDPNATSVKVGLDPSQSSGLVEIITDPDKNGVFKVTNKDSQVFKVVSTDGTYTKTQTFDLSGLTCLNS